MKMPDAPLSHVRVMSDVLAPRIIAYRTFLRARLRSRFAHDVDACCSSNRPSRREYWTRTIATKLVSHYGAVAVGAFAILYLSRDSVKTVLKQTLSEIAQKQS